MAAYTRLSRAYRVVDWDEVIPLAARILDAQGDVPTWLQRYHHLLIDEYQDFNPAEQRLLDRLIHRAESTVTVGDDDQSLYRGRGADPSGIRSLWNDASLDQVSLVLCHRCPSAIAEAANHFMRHVKDSPRPLVPTRTGGGVVVRPFKSAKAEVEFLAPYLSGCLASLAAPWDPKDGVACLFPTRDVLRQYQRALLDAGVPCELRGAVASRQSEDLLRLMLRLARQPRQPFLERLLLEQFNQIKGHHKRLLAATVTSQNIGTREGVRALVDQRRWRNGAAEDAERYLHSLDNLESRDAGRIAGEIQARFPAELACDATTIDRFLQSAADENLEDAVDAAIATLLGSEQQEPPSPKVELFTMHGSKGLTRRHIALPGLEHCWLPGEASGERLEELHRLFYVAITRSSQDVVITCPRTRARHDRLNYPRTGGGQLSEFATHLGVSPTGAAVTRRVTRDPRPPTAFAPLSQRAAPAQQRPTQPNR